LKNEKYRISADSKICTVEASDLEWGVKKEAEERPEDALAEIFSILF
jgi:hypothetical protein